MTFHGLEHSSLSVGTGCSFGAHCVIHSGEDDDLDPAQITTLGHNNTVGAMAVVFRSVLGDNVVVGDRAFVDGSTLAAGTNEPANTILINNVNEGNVEW